MRRMIAIAEGSILSSPLSSLSALKMSLSVHILIAILSFLTALFSESSGLLVGATSSGAPSQQHDSLSASSFPRPDPSGRPQLMVAIYCGTTPSSSLYYNQYLDTDSRKWRSDRGDPLAVCTRDKQAILNYCKKVYPNHDIRNIVESSRPYKLDNWCRLGTNSKRRCRARLTVKPYRCLEGTFQSDALLVPERCVFDHVHNKSSCESPEHWNRSASDICYSKNMKLQSFGMLQPCGLDVFSGVEFVCCPTSSKDSSLLKPTPSAKSDQSDGNSFAQAANGVLSSLSKKDQFKYETDTGNEIRTEDDASKKSHDDSTNEENGTDANDDDDEDDEYDDDADEDSYDDDSTTWNNGDKASSSSSTTSTTTTTTTTTTTERPIERYLSHFDLAHEHDDFKKAESAVEASYRDKITHVMREWSQLDSRYEEMKRKGDLQAAEAFKKKMTHQFQKTVEALEQESAAQRHQLATMHAERAMTIINRRKKSAMDCLAQALDRSPIRGRQVERCIVRLLKALEKDRSHTLRQYRNLLNLNTREAMKERKIILDHLVTLNRAANQSIAMLDRSPKLVEKLKTKVVDLWHRLRGVPLDEPIVRESEEKIMEQYEEEAARRKIERERKRLADFDLERSEPSAKSTAANDATKSVNADENAIDTSKNAPSNGGGGVQANQQNAPQNKASEPQSLTAATKPAEPVSTEQTASVQPMSYVDAFGEPQASSSSQSKQQTSVRSNEMGNGKKERTHYQADPIGFAHLRSEEAYHELSYSVRHEPLHGHLNFGYSAALVSTFAAIILLAFAGVKYYGKSSRRAYRRQGFAEVGRTCPEEKSVTQMQFNGYENPAYKYFGAEA
jgi:amyloid beta A4 protein